MKKNRMKRIATIITVTALVLTMSVPVFAGTFTKKDAVNKALKQAGLTKKQVRALESEYEADKAAYEIEFVQKSNRTEYSYTIAKKNGRLLEETIDYAYKHNDSTAKIGKTKARKAAAKYTGFSVKTIKKGSCKYKYDDREGIYVIKFRKGNYKYEIDILAPTGQVIEAEKDRVGK